MTPGLAWASLAWVLVATSLPPYSSRHVMSVPLPSSTSRAKYKQMERAGVGTQCAQLYLDWSAAEWDAKKPKDAWIILKKVG